MDELWNFAKQIAQSYGRKNDWVYVMDVYKSTGGKETVMEINGVNGRYEVLGEASPSLILVLNSDGEITTIEKSLLSTFRKKFYKRDVENVNQIEKSVVIEGKKQNVVLYLGKEK